MKANKATVEYPMDKIPANWREGSRQEQIAYQAVKDRNKGDGPDLGFLWGVLNKKEQARYMLFFDSKIEIEKKTGLLAEIS